MVDKTPKGWAKEGKFLVKTFKFKTFIEAIGFLNIVGTIAEELMHHPDFSLEKHSQLTIKTTTHEKGKLTEKDFELAERVNKILLR